MLPEEEHGAWRTVAAMRAKRRLGSSAARVQHLVGVHGRIAAGVQRACAHAAGLLRLHARLRTPPRNSARASTWARADTVHVAAAGTARHGAREGTEQHDLRMTSTTLATSASLAVGMGWGVGRVQCGTMPLCLARRSKGWVGARGGVRGGAAHGHDEHSRSGRAASLQRGCCGRSRRRCRCRGRLWRRCSKGAQVPQQLPVQTDLPRCLPLRCTGQHG